MEMKGKIVLGRAELRSFGIIVSNTTLLRWEAAGRFPRRIRMAGTTVAWLKSEIDQWLEKRSEERARAHYAEY